MTEDYSYTYDGWYDFGARWYDTKFAHWTTMDPLAEKYYAISPYVYCAGNPVNLVDPDGKKVKIYYTKNGKTKSFLFTGKEVILPKNEFVRSFVRAYYYNKLNWINAGYSDPEPTSRLVEREETVNIRNSETAGDYFSERYNCLYWNPETGIILDNGNVQSPASGLAHESDHANDYLDNPSLHKRRRNTNDPNYETKEEKRVITGSEQKTALANGEIQQGQVTRKYHKGITVIVNNVTSTTINHEKTQEFIKRKKKDVWRSLSSE